MKIKDYGMKRTPDAVSKRKQEINKQISVWEKKLNELRLNVAQTDAILPLEISVVNRSEAFQFIEKEIVKLNDEMQVLVNKSKWQFWSVNGRRKSS